MTLDFDEQLINQLVIYDSGLDQTAAGVFKTVFAAGRQSEFLKALSAYAHSKDAEIERVCHQHFQLFVKSIDELLALRAEAAGLRAAVVEVQQELGRCGQLLYDTKVEMHETQKMLYNTTRNIVAMNDCLQALNLAQQATLEVMDQNFGQALRLIEQLQTQLLPRIEQFSFAAKLQKWIPSQLSTVRSFAVEELKMWLSRVREQSPIIGELAFAQSQRRIEKWRELYEGVATPTASAHGLSISTDDARSAAAYIDLVEMEREDAANIIDCPQVQVDFVPLLRAVHLFDLMNRRSEFQSLFAEYRRAQAKVIFDMPVDLRNAEAKSFANFLHNVCGFFILEYFIVRKPQKFYSAAHVEGLWESAVSLVNNYVLESLGLSSEQAVFMKIKWLQVFFLHSIEVYDLYSISSMLDTILSLFYRYVDLNKVDYSQRLQSCAASCALQPLPVTSSNTVARVRRQFTFIAENKDMDSATKFPFSQFVLEVYSCVSEFIGNFYIFLEGIPQQSSELDDIAKKTADWLLDEASRAYTERLESADFEGVVQIVRDFDCLAQLCQDIARLLSTKRSRVQTTPIVIYSVDLLVKAGHNAEARLFSLINHEIDQIVASQKYEYMPVQRLELVAKMRSRLEPLLPAKSISQLFFNMFSHLAGRLTNILYDKDVPSINVKFVENLGADLVFVEGLAQELVQDPAILEGFAEVRQLVALITAERVHEFLDPIVRTRKYANLRSKDIIIVLEKVKDPIEKRRAFDDMVLLLR